MADTLRIKRRTTGSPGAPPSLANAEIAYNEVDHTLYYGEGTGGAGGTATAVVAIGGPGVLSSSLPVMNGAANAGSATQSSRSDHIHPTDTSRLPLTGNTNTIFANVPGATVKGNYTGSTGPVTDVTSAQLQSMIGLSLYALKADPTFTGDPKAPTPAVGDNDTSIATTAFVTTAVAGAIQGLDAKQSVSAATTANITLSGMQTIDGYSAGGNDRILVKNQTNPTENGIYLCQVVAWTRTTDMDAWIEVPSAYVWVEQGTVNADTGWVCTTDVAGSFGTTPISWVQFSGAGQVVAGAGLTKTGTSIDVIGTANRILVNPDSIDIDAAYVGQPSIITLGTVTTGIWNATTIAVNKGGTGTTTLTGHVIGNGAGAFTASATIPSTDITGLGTMAAQNANAVAITGGTIDGVTLDGGTF